jgi:hypothetical protein
MTKRDYLQLIRLLAAVEALMMANKVNTPDYLYEWLGDAALKLEAEVIE